MSLLVPSVVESTSRGDRSADLYSRLLSNRIVFLGHAIGPDVANLVCAQLLHLAADHADRSIQLYVNSPGGDIDAALAIYDTMQHVPPPISTVCVGGAASVAALIVAAGTAGERMALPNASFVLHQPGAERRGQITDLLLAADLVDRQRRRVETILAHHIGSTADQVRADTDRELTLTAAEAVDYGLIDTVLQPGAETTERTVPLHPTGG